MTKIQTYFYEYQEDKTKKELKKELYEIYNEKYVNELSLVWLEELCRLNYISIVKVNRIYFKGIRYPRS